MNSKLDLLFNATRDWLGFRAQGPICPGVWVKSEVLIRYSRVRKGV